MTLSPIVQNRRRPALLLLTGMAACLALLNWRLLTAEIDASPIAAPPESEGALAPARWALDERPAAEPQAFVQTLARPLFRSSRRPPETDKPQTAPRPQIAARQPAKLPENLQLIGIMKPSGRAGKALIRIDGSAGEWVEVGHMLQGWRISQIDAASIRFETEGRQQVLSLFPPKAE
jgi:hypothetical protein